MAKVVSAGLLHRAVRKTFLNLAPMTRCLYMGNQRGQRAVEESKACALMSVLNMCYNLAFVLSMKTAGLQDCRITCIYFQPFSLWLEADSHRPTRNEVGRQCLNRRRAFCTQRSSSVSPLTSYGMPESQCVARCTAASLDTDISKNFGIPSDVRAVNNMR